jgi:hypothetical protein
MIPTEITREELERLRQVASLIVDAVRDGQPNPVASSFVELHAETGGNVYLFNAIEALSAELERFAAAFVVALAKDESEAATASTRRLMRAATLERDLEIVRSELEDSRAAYHDLGRILAAVQADANRELERHRDLIEDYRTRIEDYRAALSKRVPINVGDAAKCEVGDTLQIGEVVFTCTKAVPHATVGVRAVLDPGPSRAPARPGANEVLPPERRASWARGKTEHDT